MTFGLLWTVAPTNAHFSQRSRHDCMAAANASLGDLKTWMHHIFHVWNLSLHKLKYMHQVEHTECLKCIPWVITLYISSTPYLFFIFPEYNTVLTDCNTHLHLHVSAPELHLRCMAFCNLDACWIKYNSICYCTILVPLIMMGHQ